MFMGKGGPCTLEVADKVGRQHLQHTVTRQPPGWTRTVQKPHTHSLSALGRLGSDGRTLRVL